MKTIEFAFLPGDTCWVRGQYRECIIENVLVEEKMGEHYIGHTENYIKCYIKEECVLGEMVSIKISKPYLDGALANITALN